MNLSNLKPAEGSTKTRKRIGRGPGSGLDLVWEELLPEVIKVLSKDLDTLRRLVLKVVRCLFSVVFLNSVSRTLTV